MSTPKLIGQVRKDQVKQIIEKGQAALAKAKAGRGMTEQDQIDIQAMWNAQMNQERVLGLAASVTEAGILDTRIMVKRLMEQTAAPQDPKDDPVQQMLFLIQGIACQVDEIHRYLFQPKG